MTRVGKQVLPDLGCSRRGKKKIDQFLSLSFSSLISPSLTKKKLPTVTMEDIFEGAVGIDLGTTYSYVCPSLNLSLS